MSSPNDELLALLQYEWDRLALQIHPTNHVISMNRELFTSLGDRGKEFFIQKARALLGTPVEFVPDKNPSQVYLVNSYHLKYLLLRQALRQKTITSSQSSPASNPQQPTAIVSGLFAPIQPTTPSNNNTYTTPGTSTSATSTGANPAATNTSWNGSGDLNAGSTSFWTHNVPGIAGTLYRPNQDPQTSTRPSSESNTAAHILPYSPWPVRANAQSTNQFIVPAARSISGTPGRMGTPTPNSQHQPLIGIPTTPSSGHMYQPPNNTGSQVWGQEGYAPSNPVWGVSEDGLPRSAAEKNGSAQGNNSSSNQAPNP
ncbi:hypothetical protein GGR51DRAFT_561732 [Nemania sp. FL0031]|nr:hypothetical protein GGR51DRAFT_561732 [Nemania sp. FL0031]